MKLAVIRAEECIGCSKCVASCPVDAIVGTNKFLHVVLTEDCIGCELCVEPCPVDCIDIIEVAVTESEKLAKAQLAKENYRKRTARLSRKNKLLMQPLDSDSDEIRQALKNILNL